MGSRYFIEKRSDPFADSLTANAVSAMVKDLSDLAFGDQVTVVMLYDEGSYYRIESSHVLDREALEAALVTPYAPVLFIETPKQLPEDGMPSVNYEGKRDKRADYFEWLRSLPAEQRRAYRKGGGAAVANAPEEPYQYWDILRATNPLALPGHNSLVKSWWQVREAHIEIIAALLETFSQVSNDLNRLAEFWKELDSTYGWGIKADATGLQLFNPGQGKGQNRAKANGLSMGNEKDLWLLEYLKLMGFYEVAVTRQLSTQDRRSYVIVPRQINVRKLGAIMEKFSRSMYGGETPVRSDILAALRLTITLLENAGYDEDWGWSGGYVTDIISGFETVFYKNLGNADATMNLSTLALPGWVMVQDADDLRNWVTGEPKNPGILDEHMSVIRSMDESHSEELEILRVYRDFLSGSDFNAFFEFTRRYAGHIISQRERGKYVRELTEKGLERLLMDYADITQDEGFQHIAAAIRYSTVIPQYRKARGESRLYDVRYGLHHDLSRAAYRTDEFIRVLSDFITKYNAENAQIAETRKVQYRKNVSTTDLESLLVLIDTYGGPVVCNLLIAYGYARAERDSDGENVSADETD